MLGGLAQAPLAARRRAAGESAEQPNMVMGINVQICWEKFCNYFEVEPSLRADGGEPLPPEWRRGGQALRREHHRRGRRPGLDLRRFLRTGGRDLDALDDLQERTGLDVPIHVDGASGAMIAPFLDPDLVWDFRLPRVASINTSGHKYGRVYPGVGWALWRDPEALPENLVFRVNYLGGDMPTFALNFAPRLADRGAVLQLPQARLLRATGVSSRR